MFAGRYFAARFFAPRYFAEGDTGGASTPLAPPVLSFTYSTLTAIRLSFTDATGGDGAYSYTINRNGAEHATGVSSPYDDGDDVSAGVQYTYSVTVEDGTAETETSNEVTAALPFDGTGGGGGVVDVTDGDRLNLVRGDDHTEGDRLPRWTFENYTGPSMVGGTCVLRLLRIDRYNRKDASRREFGDRSHDGSDGDND